MTTEAENPKKYAPTFAVREHARRYPTNPVDEETTLGGRPPRLVEVANKVNDKARDDRATNMDVEMTDAVGSGEVEAYYRKVKENEEGGAVGEVVSYLRKNVDGHGRRLKKQKTYANIAAADKEPRWHPKEEVFDGARGRGVRNIWSWMSAAEETMKM